MKSTRISDAPTCATMKKENSLESKKNYNAPKMDVVELKHGANSLQFRTN